jgi:hypothetical protein
MGRVAPDCSTRRRKGAATRIYVARYASLAPSPDPPPPPCVAWSPSPETSSQERHRLWAPRPLSPAHRLTPQHSQPSPALFQQSIHAGLTRSYYPLTTPLWRAHSRRTGGGVGVGGDGSRSIAADRQIGWGPYVPGPDWYGHGIVPRPERSFCRRLWRQASGQRTSMANESADRLVTDARSRGVGR